MMVPRWHAESIGHGNIPGFTLVDYGCSVSISFFLLHQRHLTISNILNLAVLVSFLDIMSCACDLHSLCITFLLSSCYGKFLSYITAVDNHQSPRHFISGFLTAICPGKYYGSVCFKSVYENDSCSV